MSTNLQIECEVEDLMRRIQANKRSRKDVYIEQEAERLAQFIISEYQKGVTESKLIGRVNHKVAKLKRRNPGQSTKVKMIKKFAAEIIRKRFLNNPDLAEKAIQ
jgi:hypothetical protein